MRRTRNDWDQWWTALENRVIQLIKSGERDLNRIILLSSFPNHLSLSDEFAQPERSQRIDDYIVDRQILRCHNYSYQAIRQGIRSARIQEIISACDRSTERIIELGAGYACQLFSVWLNGGPREAEYHAYEFSPKARNVAKIIKDTTGFSQLKIHDFDFYNPNLSNLDNKPTVVFTNYSIEGIPMIKPALIEAISQIPGLQKCIHLEPIGWQIKDTAWLASKNVFSALKNKSICKKIDFDTKRAYSNWANTNLYSVLEQMQKKRLIKIVKIIKNFNGRSCDVNGRSCYVPATLIIWQKNRESHT